MKQTHTETGAATSRSAAVTLDSLMNLTHKERCDLVQAYHEAVWACHIVAMMSDRSPMSPADFKAACDRYSHGNKAAARIAHDYLTLGNDVQLPIVPADWYRAVENAQ